MVHSRLNTEESAHSPKSTDSLPRKKQANCNACTRTLAIEAFALFLVGICVIMTMAFAFQANEWKGQAAALLKENNYLQAAIKQYKSNEASKLPSFYDQSESIKATETAVKLNKSATEFAPVKPKPKAKPKPKKPVAVSGTTKLMRVYFYCPCAKCCGKTNGITASGAKAKAGVTVAASSAYKFGTKLKIAGVGIRTVQDRGGSNIQGGALDVFVSSHAEALRRGTFMAKVTVVR